MGNGKRRTPQQATQHTPADQEQAVAHEGAATPDQSTLGNAELQARMTQEQAAGTEAGTNGPESAAPGAAGPAAAGPAAGGAGKAEGAEGQEQEEAQGEGQAQGEGGQATAAPPGGGGGGGGGGGQEGGGGGGGGAGGAGGGGGGGGGDSLDLIGPAFYVTEDWGAQDPADCGVLDLIPSAPAPNAGTGVISSMGATDPSTTGAEVAGLPNQYSFDQRVGIATSAMGQGAQQGAQSAGMGLAMDVGGFLATKGSQSLIASGTTAGRVAGGSLGSAVPVLGGVLAGVNLVDTWKKRNEKFAVPWGTLTNPDAGGWERTAAGLDLLGSILSVAGDVLGIVAAILAIAGVISAISGVAAPLAAGLLPMALLMEKISLGIGIASLVVSGLAIAIRGLTILFDGSMDATEVDEAANSLTEHTANALAQTYGIGSSIAQNRMQGDTHADASDANIEANTPEAVTTQAAAVSPATAGTQGSAGPTPPTDAGTIGTGPKAGDATVAAMPVVDAPDVVVEAPTIIADTSPAPPPNAGAGLLGPDGLPVLQGPDIRATDGRALSSTDPHAGLLGPTGRPIAELPATPQILGPDGVPVHSNPFTGKGGPQSNVVSNEYRVDPSTPFEPLATDLIVSRGEADVVTGQRTPILGDQGTAVHTQDSRYTTAGQDVVARPLLGPDGLPLGVEPKILGPDGSPISDKYSGTGNTDVDTKVILPGPDEMRRYGDPNARHSSLDGIPNEIHVPGQPSQFDQLRGGGVDVLQQAGWHEPEIVRFQQLRQQTGAELSMGDQALLGRGTELLAQHDLQPGQGMNKVLPAGQGSDYATSAPVTGFVAPDHATAGMTAGETVDGLALTYNDTRYGDRLNPFHNPDGSVVSNVDMVQTQVTGDNADHFKVPVYPEAAGQLNARGVGHEVRPDGDRSVVRTPGDAQPVVGADGQALNPRHRPDVEPQPILGADGRAIHPDQRPAVEPKPVLGRDGNAIRPEQRPSKPNQQILGPDGKPYQRPANDNRQSGPHMMQGSVGGAKQAADQVSEAVGPTPAEQLSQTGGWSGAGALKLNGEEERKPEDVFPAVTAPTSATVSAPVPVYDYATSESARPPVSEVVGLEPLPAAPHDPAQVASHLPLVAGAEARAALIEKDIEDQQALKANADQILAGDGAVAAMEMDQGAREASLVEAQAHTETVQAAVTEGEAQAADMQGKADESEASQDEMKGSGVVPKVMGVANNGAVRGLVRVGGGIAKVGAGIVNGVGSLFGADEPIIDTSTIDNLLEFFDEAPKLQSSSSQMDGAGSPASDASAQATDQAAEGRAKLGEVEAKNAQVETENATMQGEIEKSRAEAEEDRDARDAKIAEREAELAQAQGARDTASAVVDGELAAMAAWKGEHDGAVSRNQARANAVAAQQSSPTLTGEQQAAISERLAALDALGLLRDTGSSKLAVCATTARGQGVAANGLEYPASYDRASDESIAGYEGAFDATVSPLIAQMRADLAAATPDRVHSVCAAVDATIAQIKAYLAAQQQAATSAITALYVQIAPAQASAK